jgi:hypothetical protein
MGAMAILGALIEARAMVQTGRKLIELLGRQIETAANAGELTDAQKEVLLDLTEQSETAWDAAVAAAKERLGEQ